MPPEVEALSLNHWTTRKSLECMSLPGLGGPRYPGATTTPGSHILRAPFPGVTEAWALPFPPAAPA